MPKVSLVDVTERLLGGRVDDLSGRVLELDQRHEHGQGVLTNEQLAEQLRDVRDDGAAALRQSINYLRTHVFNGIERFSLVFIDPGFGFFAVINDALGDLLELEIDKQSKSFVQNDCKARRGDRRVSKRSLVRLQREQRYRDAVTTLLSRRDGCGDRNKRDGKVLVVLGKNYLHQMKGVVWELVRRPDVVVLLVEESGTSLHCYLHQTLSVAAVALKNVYLCKKAAEKLAQLFKESDKKPTTQAEAPTGAVCSSMPAAGRAEPPTDFVNTPYGEIQCCAAAAAATDWPAVCEPIALQRALPKLGLTPSSLASAQPLSDVLGRQPSQKESKQGDTKPADVPARSTDQSTIKFDTRTKAAMEAAGATAQSALHAELNGMPPAPLNTDRDGDDDSSDDETPFAMPKSKRRAKPTKKQESTARASTSSQVQQQPPQQHESTQRPLTPTEKLHAWFAAVALPRARTDRTAAATSGATSSTAAADAAEPVPDAMAIDPLPAEAEPEPEQSQSAESMRDKIGAVRLPTSPDSKQVLRAFGRRAVASALAKAKCSEATRIDRRRPTPKAPAPAHQHSMCAAHDGGGRVQCTLGGEPIDVEDCEVAHEISVATECGIEVIAFNRSLQVLLPLSAFSNSQLRRRRVRWLARARCEQCADKHQRCQECLQKRACNTIRLACAGTGLCQCKKGVELTTADLGSVLRVQHGVDDWRKKRCAHTETDEHGHTHQHHHHYHRDRMAAGAFALIVRHQHEHGGRANLFCHRLSTTPSMSPGGAFTGLVHDPSG